LPSGRAWETLFRAGCRERQTEELPVSDFDDDRLYAALREYVRAAETLSAIEPQDEPRRTLDLAEQKSLAGMAVRRRLIELGWTPPARRVDPAPEVSSGQAPAPTSERDIDV
jgi:hypothetical protein